MEQLHEGGSNQLSRAALKALVLKRLDKVVLWPSVSAQMRGLLDSRSSCLGAYTDSLVEPRIITYHKLKSAVVAGNIVEYSQITAPCKGWVATISGPDALGEPLIVSVRILDDQQAVLEITSFVIPQS
jgi:hypothetical protein